VFPFLNTQKLINTCRIWYHLIKSFCIRSSRSVHRNKLILMRPINRSLISLSCVLDSLSRIDAQIVVGITPFWANIREGRSRFRLFIISMSSRSVASLAKWQRNQSITSRGTGQTVVSRSAACDKISITGTIIRSYIGFCISLSALIPWLERALAIRLSAPAERGGHHGNCYCEKIM